jgi:uncharacterized protein (TIGR02452 family)
MTIIKNREYRAGIAQQTLSVLDQGTYQNLHGATVSIASDLAFAKMNSVHYTTEHLTEMLSSVAPQDRFVTRFEVTNESTLAAARRHVGNGMENPLCLNFASAKNPGGGFLGGSEAQEENLAKSSGLYPCIVQMSAMYEANRSLKTCVYSDDMIYSPKVPVFRDDEYQFLDEAFLASMVTAPAVNRGAIARNEPERLDQVASIMCARIDKLLALAIHHRHKCLILGAWGCGVFGNRAEDMAKWFATHLLHNPRYRDAFELVSFAVLNRKNDGTFNAFNAVFGENRADSIN